RLIELELPGTAEIRAAGVAVVQRAQVPPDRAPDLLLLVGIVDPRHRLAVAVLERDARDGVAPGAIDGIAEAGIAAIAQHRPRCASIWSARSTTSTSTRTRSSEISAKPSPAA